MQGLAKNDDKKRESQGVLVMVVVGRTTQMQNVPTGPSVVLFLGQGLIRNPDCRTGPEILRAAKRKKDPPQSAQRGLLAATKAGISTPRHHVTKEKQSQKELG